MLELQLTVSARSREAQQPRASRTATNATPQVAASKERERRAPDRRFAAHKPTLTQARVHRQQLPRPNRTLRPHALRSRATQITCCLSSSSLTRNMTCWPHSPIIFPTNHRAGNRACSRTKRRASSRNRPRKSRAESLARIFEAGSASTLHTGTAK